MNFKRFHESSNLFNISTWNNATATRGTISISGNMVTLTATSNDCYTDTYMQSVYNIPVISGETYTLSWDTDYENGMIYVFTGTTSAVAILTYTQSSKKSITVTVPNNHTVLLFRLGVSSAGDVGVYSNIMLNTGSTPLPYEPYSSEVWHDTPHYIHNTSTDTITTLPAVLYPNASTATVGLKGNTLQSSIPSPTSPVMPQGTGDMSSNILTAYKENYSISSTGEEIYNNVAMIYKTEVAVTGSTFTLNFGGLLTGDAVRIHAYIGNTWQEQIAAINITQVPFSFTVGSNIDNIRVSIRKTATDVAMTDGQYKIPISSANTTTPVYLGEVETTRKIKKYEFTGKENISDIGDYYNTNVSVLSIAWGATISTTDGFQISNSGNKIWARKSNFSSYATPADFKSYLAQQYANGTPVTVWYVLATPETAVVNEPLSKIGDYADEVSSITIPTIAGTNTLSVDTTVLPSEVTVNYKGWHSVADVHERENGQWD